MFFIFHYSFFFRCSVCYDYDLCNDCAMRGVTTKEHESNHPMDHLAPVPPRNMIFLVFCLY